MLGFFFIPFTLYGTAHCTGQNEKSVTIHLVYPRNAAKICHLTMLLGECNTILSAYTMYRHLE